MPPKSLFCVLAIWTTMIACSSGNRAVFGDDPFHGAGLRLADLQVRPRHPAEHVGEAGDVAGLLRLQPVQRLGDPPHGLGLRSARRRVRGLQSEVLEDGHSSYRPFLGSGCATKSISTRSTVVTAMVRKLGEKVYPERVGRML